MLFFLDFVATLVECSESESKEMCGGACNSVGIRLSVKSFTQKGISANGSSASFLPSLRDSCPSLLVACSSLRSNTEPDDELDAALFPDAWSASGLNDSYGSDAGDELLPELTDNPGTTRGTKLYVLQMMLFPFGVNRGSWLLTHLLEYPRSLQSLPSDGTAGVSSSSCTVTIWSKSWTNTCASSWFCTSPFAIYTTVGVLDLFTVPNSSELDSFLLIMCIDAPESTTNSRSSGLVEVGAGKK